MPQDIRLWEFLVKGELLEIEKSHVELEERLEDWLEQDISIISSDLLVIGRQVKTDSGGSIDLLCIDHHGDLAVVELKRAKTPRDITAQTLDYASWVNGLSNEQIRDITSAYFGDDDAFENAYSKRFGEGVPEVLNEQHQMIIVAEEVDSGSERIINYLSDSHGISINAATFQFFKCQDGKDLVARVFLIEPSQVEYKTMTKGISKRKPPLTYDELREIAERKGVGQLFDTISDEIDSIFDQRITTRSTVGFIGVIEGSRNTIFSLKPFESEESQGLRFYLYIERLMEYLGAENEEIISLLPPKIEEEIPYKNAPLTIFGFFNDKEQIRRFVEGLLELHRSR